MENKSYLVNYCSLLSVGRSLNMEHASATARAEVVV